MRRPADYYRGSYYSAEFIGKNSWNGREGNFAYVNLDGENFIEAGFALGIDSIADSRSFVGFDFDHDGDADLLVHNANGFPANLYVNRLVDGSTNHWLKVRLARRGAIQPVGATVRVRTGDRVQTQVVSTSNGYAASYRGPLLFGLGPATRVDAVEVTWPGGRRTVIEDVTADRLLEIAAPGR